ncbi:Tim44/TimA family putative adaptor protein [Hyphomonas sp. FCG-A18]|jgi:predicted lipid-binding transport protein (Tim44 family)|uniref:Tim44/TimA family putative adaptor protein n=1 Tax=Hyphomonas sp. FCG-A18 TaxID=3080019 RepID=UPI002B2E0DC8|nr:Tim44/TimA family putative adaptor protein [Hyphomonas sp. FCG-A18]
MSQAMIEVLLLAGIAIFIGWRLYVTLGQDQGPPEGRPRGPQAEPMPQAPTEKPTDNVTDLRPSFTGPAASGLEAIYEADQSFNPRTFVQGAKGAYEIIVGAFARGDRDALKPMLDTDVYEAWDAAIAEREANNSPAFELLRLRSAEITEASLDDARIARVTVEFQAELGDGETTSRSDEFWTFMRSVDSNDPNWILDDVDTP